MMLTAIPQPGHKHTIENSQGEPILCGPGQPVDQEDVP